MPDASWVECKPWEHVALAKSLPEVKQLRASDSELDNLWDLGNDEALRDCLARLGMIKVCYHLVDANHITMRQLIKLQDVHAFSDSSLTIEFIGKIRLKIELRILLKLKNVDRLNQLADFG